MYEPRMLTLAEAAARLQLTRAQLQAIDDARLPRMYVGRCRIYFRPADVLAFDRTRRQRGR